jgi:Kef-type K+ transport system membrane component KefB
MAPNEVLGILSDLGVIFLLFSIGLGVRGSELLRVGGTAVAVAVPGVTLSLLAGWGVSTLRGAPPIEGIFTAAAMVATSVGITARVQASRRLLDTRAARIILAAAVVDDVLGLIVLALVTGLARGPVKYLDVVLTAGIAIAFTYLMATIGRRTVKAVIARVQARVRLGRGRILARHDAAL